ncbi:hypothetical protein K440DRAFT_540557, partial [Wilcoxina mikolae CBS 423.85]
MPLRGLRGGFVVILAVITCIHIDTARADDSGDSFTNNLLTDLAPILSLFGEQVTKQFLSQSFTWYECVIFAVCPLGIITAVVSAIRVAAPTSWKAVVGRARESRAAAELELLSSTSDEVCELWSGEAIVRVMGSPQVLELVYIKGGANCGLYTLQEQREKIREGNDKDKVLEIKSGQFKRLCSEGNLGISAPNISLNLVPPPEKKKLSLRLFMAFGVTLQLGILLFCAMATNYSPWKPTFKKNGVRVIKPAFPLTAVGTMLNAVGMFICAWIIEQSTEEEVWKVRHDLPTINVSGQGEQATESAPPKAQIHMLWLQRGKVVNDQTFNSYAIFAPGPRDSIFTSRRNDKIGPREPKGSSPKYVKLGLSLEELAMIGAVVSIVGFILQFSGLRFSHWSATMAQFMGTGIMTGVRIWLRRDLSDRPNALPVPDGFEMDWLALELTAKEDGLW